VKTIEWLGRSLRVLDQTKLPIEEVYREAKSYLEVPEQNCTCPLANIELGKF
jgi:methylthioribose-1-phosphate isomerase